MSFVVVVVVEVVDDDDKRSIASDLVLVWAEKKIGKIFVQLRWRLTWECPCSERHSVAPLFTDKCLCGGGGGWLTVRYGLLPIHFESPRGRKASQSRADGPQVLLLRHLRQRRRRRDEEDAPFLFALLPSPSFVYGHPAGERRPLSLTLTHTLKLVVFLLSF